MNDQIFSSVRNERVYEKIVGQIRHLIDQGKLNPGDRLPSERELAQTLGCSRTSLREACRVLESEGMIISKPGGGRFIQRADRDMTLKYRFNPVDLLEKSAVLYFVEARETIEPKISELASQRATTKDIEKLERILENMEEKLKYPDAQIDGDSSFHLALAEATQNFVFVSMVEANLNMIRQVRKQTLHTKERYLQSLKEHRAILDAVKNHDASKAIEATYAHLQNLRENVMNNFNNEDVDVES